MSVHYSGELRISINGQRTSAPVRNGFASLQRRWVDGDRIQLEFELPLRLEPIDQDHPNTVAVVRGPLVLFAVGGTPVSASRRQLIYGIVVHIQGITRDALRVEEGSLYPALHRIEQDGWIRSEWGVSGNNRKAKFYEITAAGRRQLEREEKKWENLTTAVNAVLRFA